MSSVLVFTRSVWSPYIHPCCQYQAYGSIHDSRLRCLMICGQTKTTVLVSEHGCTQSHQDSEGRANYHGCSEQCDANALKIWQLTKRWASQLSQHQAPSYVRWSETTLSLVRCDETTGMQVDRSKNLTFAKQAGSNSTVIGCLWDTSDTQTCYHLKTCAISAIDNCDTGRSQLCDTCRWHSVRTSSQWSSEEGRKGSNPTFSLHVKTC